MTNIILLNKLLHLCNSKKISNMTKEELVTNVVNNVNIEVLLNELQHIIEFDKIPTDLGANEGLIKVILIELN